MKRVNIQQDYVMYQLIQLFREQLGVVCSYMQRTTPYGEEYQAAYIKYTKLSKQINEFESLLQDCVEAKVKLIDES